MNKEEQAEKLAQALVNGGIITNPADAMKRAKEIIGIREEAKEDTSEALDIRQIPKIDLGIDIDEDKSLKELLEEESREIYRNK